ncbi:hypothetical protein CP978_01630 [Streptomyces nodosus]|uniref:Uncharacterized protein n=1 Tax=Streptomyces nodosus TaxID=40318 RepID=A0A0B5DEG8_9ACTN|nr:hypothetical protein SNOD_01275 [Streptomyces nodosus]QEV37433.1 hypothetical protein CP978_01630 [Streptomyces nodosus]
MMEPYGDRGTRGLPLDGGLSAGSAWRDAGVFVALLDGLITEDAKQSRIGLRQRLAARAESEAGGVRNGTSREDEDADRGCGADYGRE